MRNVQRYGRRKRNMHVLFNTTKLYKKCVYKYRKRHYKRIFKKIIIVLLLYFCKTKTSTTKKRNLLFAVFCIGKNIFPRFVFDFLHCNLPFCTQGLAEVFCCKLFASGNGQTRRINNTLRRTYDKNLYFKIVFTCFAKTTKFACFPRFVFDFFTVICLLHTGVGRGFFVANCLPQVTDRHDTSTTLYAVRMTKTATAKLFLHALQKRQIRIFRFDGQACVKSQRRQRNLKRLHGKRFACKRQRNFCTSKNCTPNGLSDKYALCRVKNLSLLQRRQGTVGTHCDYLNTSARPASFNFSLSLTTVFSSLLGRSAFC